jgi:UrcA family protein
MNTSTASLKLRSFIASAIFGVLALSLSVGSGADPRAVSRTVNFADLDISNPSAARALYMRIRAAAAVVCSYSVFLMDSDKTRCVRDVIADAVSRINQPVLSAVYAAEIKASGPRAPVSQSREATLQP